MGGVVCWWWGEVADVGCARGVGGAWSGRRNVSIELGGASRGCERDFKRKRALRPGRARAGAVGGRGWGFGLWEAHTLRQFGCAVFTKLDVLHGGVVVRTSAQTFIRGYYLHGCGVSRPIRVEFWGYMGWWGGAVWDSMWSVAGSRTYMALVQGCYGQSFPFPDVRPNDIWSDHYMEPTEFEIQEMVIICGGMCKEILSQWEALKIVSFMKIVL
ncbi:hypothetical protein Tco_0414761 [Tanacetum coccineum]